MTAIKQGCQLQEDNVITWPSKLMHTLQEEFKDKTFIKLNNTISVLHIKLMFVRIID
jgi:hypothetical protein